MSNSELIPGGSNDTGLPEGWQAPHGWPREGNINAIWVKPSAATKDEIDEVKALGWTIDARTLVGTHAKSWTAKQYNDSRLELAGLKPCETVPKPGGDGSWTYKSQFLPSEVDKVLCEGKWVYNLDDELVRSSGGEPVMVRDLGDGVFENVQLDIEITCDADLRVWRT